MEPLYEIGDLVLIKSKYDPDKNSWDYLCGFTNEMITNYEDKLLKVKNVKFNHIVNDYIYTLEGNYWSWTKDMFQDVSKEF